MKKVVIVGAGPAGLMAAHFLSKNKKIQVQLFDANKAVARKFLVAGHGGFNLTNSEEIPAFIEKYNHSYIQNAVFQFSSEDTVKWLSEIGIETFVGTSGKIFPKKGTKPIRVLSSWMNHLNENNVSIFTEQRLIDFDGKNVSFQTEEEVKTVKYDYLVFAMGGASWKKTGSTGEWIKLFEKKGIGIMPFEASNAGISIHNWSKDLGGGVLKNTEISINGQKQFGEIELTGYGVEGAPVYALSGQVRKEAKELLVNLKPTLDQDKLLVKFRQFKGSKTDFLRAVKLSGSAISLLKNTLSKDDFRNDGLFLKAINQLILPICSLRPIDEAISTVGGISMSEINGQFELKKFPKHFCIGEMLDWDAPTGGYLLQACFAMGFVAANIIPLLEDRN